MKIRIQPVEGYDELISSIGGFGIHACSECGGTKEVTGHKYWCKKGKKSLEVASGK